LSYPLQNSWKRRTRWGYIRALEIHGMNSWTTRGHRTPWNGHSVSFQTASMFPGFPITNLVSTGTSSSRCQARRLCCTRRAIPVATFIGDRTRGHKQDDCVTKTCSKHVYSRERRFAIQIWTPKSLLVRFACRRFAKYLCHNVARKIENADLATSYKRQAIHVTQTKKHVIKNKINTLCNNKFQNWGLPYCQRPSFIPIQNHRQNYTSLYSHFYVLLLIIKHNFTFNTVLHLQTGSEVFPTSYRMGTRGSFPRGKAAGS
jgi:hypothetical protein